MRLVIQSTTRRRKPATGDTRTTKQHGIQVRVPEMVHDIHGREVGYNCTGGRQQYVWKTPEQLTGTRWEYLIKAKGGEQ